MGENDSSAAEGSPGAADGQENSRARAVGSRQPAVPPADAPALSTQIIGQATAVLAAAAGVVYATGALSLGLRLWYDQYSWEPVLGQLPRNFVLVDAFIVIVPAILIGLIAYIGYEKLRSPSGNNLRVRPWLASIALAAVLAAAPLAFLPVVRRTTLHGVIRPYWQIYVACLILNLIFVRLALYLLPGVNSIKGLERILGVAVLAFALIPAVASVSATYRFSLVFLCGPAFGHTGPDGHYAIGDLIGTNGQWVYVAETHLRTLKSGQVVSGGGYIAVIPLSAVQLESIGPDAWCGDLHPPARG